MVTAVKADGFRSVIYLLSAPIASSDKGSICHTGARMSRAKHEIYNPEQHEAVNKCGTSYLHVCLNILHVSGISYSTANRNGFRSNVIGGRSYCH